MDNEPMIFYSHYCYDCGCCFVSKQSCQGTRCWSCNSENTTSGVDEKYKPDRSNHMITLNDEHAHALSRLVTWFERMIVDSNIGTAGLIAEYCEELKQALSTGDVPGQGSDNILRSKENDSQE